MNQKKRCGAGNAVVLIYIFLPGPAQDGTAHELERTKQPNNQPTD